MSRSFALVDCNNFYVSCERLFRPDLKNRPVIVLSNNDGCLISRSPEVKMLGLKIGTPYFQLQSSIKQHHIAVFSSNYAFYGDISFRVMQTLESLVPDIEVYSIDEAFLDLSHTQRLYSYQDYGKHIKQTVEKHVGIPVCVGIAPTKTLAKLATWAAKNYPKTVGIADISAPIRQKKLLQRVPIENVWGIGQRLARHLRQQAIETAYDLAQLPPRLARKQFSVVLERTVRELNGESCLDIEQDAPAKQQIISSRSFSRQITHYSEMRQAIACYAAKAAEKLRREKRYARQVALYLYSERKLEKTPHNTRTLSAELPFPSADTRDINQLAQRLLKKIWQDGPRYYKAGIMLAELCSPETVQYDLFAYNQPRRNSDHLMHVIDRLNLHERDKMIFAAQGIKPSWQMKRQYLSPAYTTRWTELPTVR